MPDILAYCDTQSVRAGAQVALKVSLVDAETYDLSVMRLTGADLEPSPHLPDHFEEKLVTDLDGAHPGRRQTNDVGSWIRVQKQPAFSGLRGLSAVVNIWPTRPGAGQQTVLGNFSDGRGFAIVVDAESRLTLVLPSLQSGQKRRIQCGRVERMRWYCCAVSIDEVQDRVHVVLVRLDPGADAAAKSMVSHPLHGLPELDGGSFAIAASVDPSGRSVDNFNGKIERPRLIGRAVEPAELLEIATAGPCSPAHPDSIADWDFSEGIDTMIATDISGHGCHGETVHMPTRATVGSNWSGDVSDWRIAPNEYGAIHFHDTDMIDCGWETDHELVIPENWRSGAYAFKLTCDGAKDWYAPFFVLPPKGKTGSNTALLVPTATYAAYANHLYRLVQPWHELIQGRLIYFDEIDSYLLKYPELGRSAYDTHSDGSSVHYSSLRRPVVNYRPNGRPYKFTLDLLIVAWLEQLGGDYDVITDEDLHREGSDLLKPYRVVITGSHPEYYSWKMYEGLSDYISGGGRLMYLGGNGFWWVSDWHPDPTQSGIAEVRRMMGGVFGAFSDGDLHGSLSGKAMGPWSSRGRAANQLAGVGFVAQGNDRCEGYRRTEASNDPRVGFMFDGISDDILGDFGYLQGGAAGFELDAYNPDFGSPGHGLVVASSYNHSSNYELSGDTGGYFRAVMSDPEAEPIRADITFFETPSGGAVFSTGSIAFCGSLSWNGYDNNIATLLDNVLDRFCDPAPFEVPDIHQINRPTHESEPTRQKEKQV